MDASLIAGINELRARRQACVVITDIASGKSRLVSEAEIADDPSAEIVSDYLKRGKSGLTEVESREVFLNVHIPSARLVVIGAVHISQALAQIARISGYDIMIIDPRTAFATPERFSGFELHADWPSDVLEKQPLDPYCALVAVTHDPKIDDFPIMQALEKQCFYVGALGSRKTHAARIQRLQDSGADPHALASIHAPIGLDIGASSPAEIAIAIMAEIIQSFRQRDIGGKKERPNR